MRKTEMVVAENILQRIGVSEKVLTEFCKRWMVLELSAFGSVLTKRFNGQSDVDFLVTFSPKAHWSLMDLVRMDEEIERIVGRDVDVVEKEAIEESENWIKKKMILERAKPVYVEG